MIESAKGVENADEIMATEGIDAAAVGIEGLPGRPLLDSADVPHAA